MLYTHQYPDWTNFRYNYQRVSDALGKAQFLEGKLAGIASIINGSEEEKTLLSQEISANFALDGSALDVEQVQQEIAKKNGAADPIRNILGAIYNAGSPLTEDRLFAWHAAIGQNKVRSFRTKESSVIFNDGEREHKFVGVSPDRIAHEMERFLHWFETATTDRVVKAAIAQFWFLTIRPFDDGNGRIARTLSLMLLARDGAFVAEEAGRSLYALSPQFLDRRSDYFRILSKAQAGNGDLTEWILFFIEALQHSVESRLTQIADTLRQVRFRFKFSHLAISARQQVLIDGAMSGALKPAFSVKEAAALTGVSHDSALRDIQDLIEKGVFKAEQKGGRGQKYSALL